MDGHPNWNAAGNGLANLKGLLLEEPRVMAVLRLYAGEVRRIGYEEGVRLLFGKERLERAQTTHQLKRFVTGRIPVREIPISVAAWAVLRCECACDFLGQMHPPLAKNSPVPETDWRPEVTAEWLLTELWERRHDSWLKLVALEWSGPFPFYGIEAVPEWL